MNLLRSARAMLADDGGTAMLEYAIVAAAISVPLIGIATAITGSAGTAMTAMTSGMSTVGANPP
jgi:Flp pilus assembly pilin Flp